MASTAMLNLYTSFERNDHITFDEDQSVSMTSIRRTTTAEPKEIKGEPKKYCVEIKNACYTYGKGVKSVCAMKDISIKVPQGEM
jgi:hypothetical protein